ncbi:hypothetical protein [Bradyrhizobium elkanii]|uniref:Uncharacterized protein n=1 Tax=Bradyrhizobium elkanii TaxID=29448 RepID=A0ABV4F180_BRAEL|nr:hypothetical protein [Bradyrhizobium elkanii]MCP1757764.1 hypothetical protein [Bradyrhizobium elkanii]MCS3881939.1 hypothetical protein [Bradyrhizobium elkanii]MCS4218699.1 hypothetical protein [Bradyrhizobium elkanii]MCW2109995.1 hypothetical protein [Bradyrhizobium elkanii]MCW2201634.1 hypothetical protein [Bradyrhizobium elkanii]
MSEIRFKQVIIGRADNPFLVLDNDIDVRGNNYDTLRTMAAQAMMDANFPRRTWIDFEVEGHKFKAKMHYNDIWVRKR